MEETLIKDIKQLLNNGFYFKKRLGQNFIIDNNIINNIVEKSAIDKETLVLEIGVGAGALTKKIAKVAKYVIGYEIDKSLKNHLDYASIDNIDIIYEDFLKRDLYSDICKHKYRKLVIIGNLPYYITTAIINKIIDANIIVDSIVIMIQKEVGERIVAKPGIKEYNSLSIFIDYHYEVKKLFVISNNVFIPKPKVDSMVIMLNRRISKRVMLTNENLFFQLVKDAFKQKRKNIRNNLKNYNLIIVADVLKKNGMDLTIRAENISIDIFADISNEVDKDIKKL